jgi:hypothetical protein
LAKAGAAPKSRFARPYYITNLFYLNI